METERLRQIHEYMTGLFKDLVGSDYQGDTASMIQSQIFNLMTVFHSYRSGMGFELHDPVWGGVVESVKGIISHVIEKYNITNIMMTVVNPQSFILVHHIDHIALANKVVDDNDEYALGVLLDFACPGDHANHLDDRVGHHIAVDGYDFFVQLCSRENYEQNKNQIDAQSKKFTELGDALGVEVMMYYTVSTGLRTLLKDIAFDGIAGIQKHREEIIHILVQVTQTDRFEKTIDMLRSDDTAQLEKMSPWIRIIIVSALRHISNMPFDLLEEILYHGHGPENPWNPKLI